MTRSGTTALALLLASLLATTAAGADWIDRRTNGFKEVKAAVGRIDEALSDNQLDRVGPEARRLAEFAATIPALFPEGSGQGGKTSASPDIWTHFADFKTRAEALRLSAEGLAAAADAGDRRRSEQQFEALRATCKPCHRHYKDLF